MKKWVLLLLTLCLAFSLVACGGEEATEENIVEDLEGPEGIELFAGLWYYERRDLWVEVYYDGSWCSFEDGGMLRSFGTMTIADGVGTLAPTEGEDAFVFIAGEDSLSDEAGNSLFHVTEVGIQKPLIHNELNVPDTIAPNVTVEGKVDPSFVKSYEGFYISEDGIYALEIFADGTYDLQEYGLLVESGSVLRVTEPAYGQFYAVDRDMLKYRLIIPQEERLYVGDCGIFAPGEKAMPSDE